MRLNLISGYNIIRGLRDMMHFQRSFGLATPGLGTIQSKSLFTSIGITFNFGKYDYVDHINMCRNIYQYGLYCYL